MGKWLIVLMLSAIVFALIDINLTLKSQIACTIDEHGDVAIFLKDDSTEDMELRSISVTRVINDD